MAGKNEVRIKISGEVDRSLKNAVKTAKLSVVNGLKSIPGNAREGLFNAIAGSPKALGKGLASGLKAGVGMAVSGVAAATAGVAALGAASVKTGSEFESSMSQVAATMLIDKNSAEGRAQLQTLEDAARKMGRETAFSASEAAEGLNYLALAGYDAEKAATALPTVLRIAGAGAMELADASDMVTDSMSALGIAATQENLESFGDKLAMTASKSNTNVSQLGEALIKVGGTAKGLKGGVAEASTALGVLADSGIKGSEGGTHLRNMIQSLQKGRNKEAKEIMANMGLSAYDEETGEMKGLGDTFAELNEHLAGNTAAQNNSILSTLFKQTDLAAAKAMMAATANSVESLSSVMDASLVESGQSLSSLGINLQEMADNFDAATTSEAFAKQMNDEFGMSADNAGVLFSGLQSLVGDGATRFEELSAAINDSKGAAEDMYNIQTDNLEGDVATLKSAFDDLKISIYEDTGGPLRGLTQMATQSINNINNAYQQGGAGAAAAQLGNEASTYVASIASAAPQAVNIGVQVIQNFVSGIQQNLPQITSGAAQTIVSFAQGVIQVAPNLINTGIQAIVMFAQGIAVQLPTLIPLAVQGIRTFISGFAQNIPLIMTCGAQIIAGLAGGIIGALPDLIVAVFEIPGAIISGIMNTNWVEVGKTVLNSLKEGVLGGAKSIWDALTGKSESAGADGIKAGADMAASFSEGLRSEGSMDMSSMFTNMDMSSATGAGTQAGTAFSTGMNESLTQAMDAANIMGASMESVAEQMSAAGTESGTAFGAGLSDQVSTSMDDMAGMVDLGMTNMNTAVQTGGTNIETTVSSTMTNVQTAVNSVNLTQSGSNMMQGLVNGMESKRAQVEETARSIAKAAKNAVDKAMDINSPSREMEQSGQYTGEGYALGIKGRIKSIKDAAVEMVKPVRDGADEPMSIGDRIRNTMGNAPTVNGSRESSHQTVAPTFTFSPVINVEGNSNVKKDIQDALKLGQREFNKMADNWVRSNSRLQFAGT